MEVVRPGRAGTAISRAAFIPSPQAWLEGSVVPTPHGPDHESVKALERARLFAPCAAAGKTLLDALGVGGRIRLGRVCSGPASRAHNGRDGSPQGQNKSSSGGR